MGAKVSVMPLVQTKQTRPIEVRLYRPDRSEIWDRFVADSKNGTFLFRRGYMDYHADRFRDASLMFFAEDKLIGLLPANLADDTAISHGGLTFGGVIMDSSVKTGTMAQLFEVLIAHFRNQGARKLIYKAVPHIYHRLAAEEDLYALFINNARLIRRDISSAIYNPNRLTFSKGRKSEISRAKVRNVQVRQSTDFESFMRIEEEVLSAKYNRKPVHTAAELASLAEKFPDNIKLFAAYADASMLGGVVIYESATVAHAQYISATGEGKECGALDLVLSQLITTEYAHKPWFDFGISTEQEGRYLNSGLIANKESFGARAVVYDFYELSLTS